MIGSTITRDRNQYEALLRADQPRCGAAGPDKATCVLLPDHDSRGHEGNGFDKFGPKYQSWAVTS